MALIKDDTELLLRDPAEWRRRRGLNPDDVAGDPERIRNAMGAMQEANQSPDREITGVMEGSTAGGTRPFFAVATNPVQTATGNATPPPRPAQEDPAAIRAAMGQPRAEAVPGAVPGGEAPGMGTSAIPARDRLTLAMWGNSRDTGGMRRYNEVAKRYGMDPKALPKTARQKRLEEAGVGPWEPTGRGGMGNRVTGEVNASAEAPEQIDWGKRMVKQADGTYMDMETGAVVGPKAKEDQIDWGKRMVKQADGTYKDMETGSVVGMAEKRAASDRYLNLGAAGVFDADTETFRQNPGEERKKDAFQARFVKVKTGPESHMFGVWDKKDGVYKWSKNVKNGGSMTTTLSDGSSVTLGGGGMDLADVPDFVDRDAPGKSGTQVTKGTEATGAPIAPIGTVGTVNGKRMKKVAEGKWEPV